MNRAGTLQSPFILLAVGVGLGLGRIPGLADPAGALILPLLMLMLVGVFLHVPLRGRARFEAVVLPRAASAQLALLCAAIAAMFASQGAVLLEHPEVGPRLLLPLLVFFALTLLLALALGRLAGLEHGKGAGLCCATLARNSPVALAVVVRVLRGPQRRWRPSKVDAA